MNSPPRMPRFASDLLIRWVPLLALGAVILYFFCFVDRYAINVPYHDGIYDLLRPVTLVEKADNVRDGFEELFKWHADHRTGATRLLVYVAYLVEGEINFHTLALLANMALPLILVLFYLMVRNETYRWVYLLVSGLLLLHIRCYMIVLWSQASFAYYYVFLYGFACIVLLHKVTPLRLGLAAVLCIFSTLTYAAGQLVWLLGLASLLHQYILTRSRPLSYAAVWLMLAIIATLVWRIDMPESTYFYPGSEAPAGIRDLFPDYIVDMSVPLFLERYGTSLLVTLGSALTGDSMLLAGGAGLSMLLLLLYITLRSYKDDDVRLLLCCWFVVAAAAAVTIGRARVLAPDTILVSRYSFLSVILLSSLALLLQLRLKRFKSFVLPVIVVAAGIYWAWAFRIFAPPLQEILNQRYTEYNLDMYPVYFRGEGESVTAVLEDAVSMGMYKPPCKPLPDCEKSPRGHVEDGAADTLH